MTVMKKTKFIFLALMLVAATIFFVFVWVGNGKGDQTASSNSGGAERVVQCLYEKGEPFLGTIKNTVYDAKRGCHAMTYWVPKSFDHNLVPSYGKTRQSLSVTLPQESDISKQLYEIHGVKGDVRAQVWPLDFDKQLTEKREFSKARGYLDLSEKDERFLVRSTGDESKTYYSIQSEHPFFLNCTMRNKGSDNPPEFLFCKVWTSTCNGMVLIYTTFGEPFQNLKKVDAIHQDLVRPLFDVCE